MNKRYSPVAGLSALIIEDLMNAPEMPADETLRFQLRLAIEETVDNVVAYAYADAAEGWLEVSAVRQGGNLVITLKDSGRPFNPLEQGEPDLTLPAEERPVGGLGIFLAKQMMDAVAYAYEDGCNILTLTKAVAQMPLTEQTFSEFLAARATLNTPAIVELEATCTYAELNRMADGFAVLARSMGVQAGDHVALWAENSIRWVAAFFGIIRAGAVATLMNYSLPGHEIAALMQATDVTHLFYGGNREVSADPAAAARTAAEAGIPAERVCDIRTAAVENAPAFTPAAGEDCRRTALIIYTTGTTSQPKAVQLSAYSCLNSARGIWALADEGEPIGTQTCVALPIFHSFGLAIMLGQLERGGTVYMPRRFHPEDIEAIMRRGEVTDLASVGTIYRTLTESSTFMLDVAPKVRTCRIGGAASTPLQMIRLDTAFTNGCFLPGYGQTECSPAITSSSTLDTMEQRSTAVGRPLPGLEVRIWDKERGFLPVGEVGEVVVRGYGLMNGYYKVPQEQQPIDADGWLHTGDLGHLDERSYLYLAGRSKDIIIKQGENVSPMEIEHVIGLDPAVREVRIFGAPHPIYGEDIIACIVTEQGMSVEETALKQRVRQTLSPFKTPSRCLFFDSFPLMENGKPDFRRLRLDMLNRVKALVIRERLEGGIRTASVTIKSTAFSIVPVSRMLEELAKGVGFSVGKARQICLAAEEMLLERIENAYTDVGDICIEVIFMQQVMRIRFSDYGVAYDIKKNLATSASAMIILGIVDHYTRLSLADARPAYCLDFLYEDSIDIDAFLAEQTRIES